jgi:CrcB protein
MLQTLLVFLGGGLGATGRYLVGIGALRQFGPGFPYGTIIVNIVGSLAMGLLIGWLVRKGGSNDLRLFLATGVLGGFTTFSAYSLDVANLIERGSYGPALTYMVGSVIACILAVFVGLWLVRSLTA